MAKFTIIIDTENAAFEDTPNEELARIIREVAQHLDRGYTSGGVRDVNGNRVGSFEFDES